MITLRQVITCYLLFIHLFIGLVLLKKDIITRIKAKIGMETERAELTPQYYGLLAFHKRIDKNIADNSVIFIGDSLTQGLAVSAIYPQSVNFGIGYDTTKGVLNRIPQYNAISRAKAVVIAIGFNDLNWRSNAEIIQNYLKIIDAIPDNTKIIFNTILPVNEKRRNRIGLNARINEINNKLQKICQNNPKVHFLNMTNLLINTDKNLANKYHIGDGVHLSRLGNAVWIKKIKEALYSLEKRRMVTFTELLG